MKSTVNKERPASSSEIGYSVSVTLAATLCTCQFILVCFGIDVASNEGVLGVHLFDFFALPLFFEAMLLFVTVPTVWIGYQYYVQGNGYALVNGEHATESLIESEHDSSDELGDASSE
jgi:hypothetical protein